MIKPIEKENKNKIVIFKIIFLLSLITTGVLLDRIFLTKKPSQPAQILGEEKQIEKPKTSFISETLNNAEKQLESLGGQVLGEANNFVKNTQEKIASSISDIVYKTSLEPIVNQFEKLPSDQKEKVKEAICR
ncbi:MAG: hypothetical protein Fur009_5460 [Candidatus Microgenomates bacterium]